MNRHSSHHDPEDDRVTRDPGRFQSAEALVSLSLAGAAIVGGTSVVLSADGELGRVFDPLGALWFPLAVCAALSACGLVIARRSQRSATPGTVRALAAVTGVAIYVGGVFLIGYWPASTVAIVAFGAALGASLLNLRLLATAAVMPGLIAAAFATGLGVTLPSPFPWFSP